MKNIAYAVVAALTALVGIQAEATIHWWEEAEVAKTIALGTTGEAPKPMAGNDRLLFVPTAQGASATLFEVEKLTRRKGGEGKLFTRTVEQAMLSGEWTGAAIGGQWIIAGASSLRADTFPWANTTNACALATSGGSAYDAAAFATDGAKLYSNTAGGSAAIQTWTVGGQPWAGATLTYSSSFSSTHVADIRALAVASFGGKDLLYYGEGAAESGAEVCVYDPGTGAETQLTALADPDAAISNVKPTDDGYLQVFCADGRVFVYQLAADGLALVSSTPTATVDLAALVEDATAFTSLETSPDGLALFAAPAMATDMTNNLYVVRSAKYGLVDAVTSMDSFPWRDDGPTMTPHSMTTIGSVTIPDPNTTWADPALYKRISYNKFLTNTIANLTAGDDYKYEYHVTENYFQNVGQRIWDITVNGVLVHEDFDAIKDIGGRWIAHVETYYTTADNNGRIVCSLVWKVDQPVYVGFAAWGREKPSNFSFGTDFSADGTTGTLTWSATDAHAYYVESAPTREGPWTQILRDQVAKKLVVNPTGRTYYRVVASNGVGTVTSPVRCSQQDKFPVYAINCGFDIAKYGRFTSLDHFSSPIVPMRDTNFSSTSAGTSLVDLVPQGMMNSALYSPGGNPFRFHFKNLRADKTYDIRVYVQESYFNTAGSRLMSLAVNGAMVDPVIDTWFTGGRRYATGERVYPGLAPNAEGELNLEFKAIRSDVDLAGVEIVENDSEGVPLVPVVKGVFPRSHGVQVAIGVGTGDLKYDIRRRPAGGGDWVTCLTGLDDYAWLDTGVTDGYVYSVRAVNAAGAASDWSAEVAIAAAAATPQKFIGLSPLRNQSYSNANGTYVPYNLYSFNGTGYAETAQVYHHSLVIDPAPDALYSRILYNSSMGFTFTNLYPSATYRLRLQAIESYFNENGRRVTSGLYVNTVKVHNGFDAFREVGKGVFPIELIVKSSPEGIIHFFTTQAKDNIDLATIELFLLEENGAAGVLTGTCENRQWSNGTASDFNLAGAAAGDVFLWDAILTVPAAGEYTFDATQSGNYTLWIDDEIALQAKNGEAATGKITLPIGDHHIRARLEKGAGAPAVALGWTGPTFARRALAAGDLSRSRTVDMSQDKWLNAEIFTTIPGDFYKVNDVVGLNGTPVWRMTATGEGFYGARDYSHFMYQVVTAPAFELRCRIRRIPDYGDASTIGLTLRTALEHHQGDYVQQIITGSTGPGQATRWHVGWQGADFTQGQQVSNAVDWDKHLPMTQRIRKWRENGKNYADYSYSLDDGATWKVCRTNELSGARTIYAGIEACSYTYQNGERLITFEFDGFELEIPPLPGTLLIIR